MECLVMNYSDDEVEPVPVLETELDCDETIKLEPDTNDNIEYSITSLEDFVPSSFTPSAALPNTVHENESSETPADSSVVNVSDDDADLSSQTSSDALSSILITRVETVQEEPACSTASKELSEEIQPPPPSTPELPIQAQKADTPKIVFKCYLCTFSTTLRFALDRHQAEHDKGEVKPEVKLFKCQWCLYTSKTRFALNKHITAAHRKITTIKCHLCPFKTESKKGFCLHSLKVHGKSKCARCGKHVPAQMKQEHLEVCKKKPDFECNVCDYKTKNRTKFAWHQTRLCKNSKVQQSKCEDDKSVEIPKLKVFKCELCPFTSKIRFGLKHHMATHTNNTLKCNVCSFEAKSKHGIYLHALFQHETTKCPRCQKDMPVQLKNKHVCRKVPPCFECNACGFKTAFKRKFLWHKSRQCKNSKAANNEPDEIPKLTVFKCRLCPFSSKIRFALKKHMTSHNSEANFKCNECSYEADSKKAFYGHLLGAHKSSTKACSRCHKQVPLQMSDRHLQICKMKKGQKLTCSYCSFITHAEHNMQAHVSRHSQDKSIVLKCRKCDYKSSQLNVFKHIKSVHKLTIFKCKFCSYSAPSEYLITQHASQHTVSKEPIMKCDQCDYRSTHLNVVRHFTSVHGTSSDAEKKSTKASDGEKKSTTASDGEKKSTACDKLPSLHCKFCSFVARSNAGLLKHLGWHNIVKRPIVACDQCDYKSTSKKIQQHQRIVHGRSKTERKKLLLMRKRKALLKCTFCSFTTKFKVTFDKHTKLHVVRNVPIYACDECDYKSTKWNLAKHASEMHGKKFDFKQQQQTYTCSACPFTHTDKATYKKHLFDNHQVKSDVLLHACKHCSYKTKELRYLKLHMMVHAENNGTLHSCTECTFKGVTFNLLNHLKTAHGIDKTKIRIYKCEFCSYIAHGDLQLNQHVKLHTVHKKSIFQCDKCDYRSTSHNLTRHKKISHLKPAFVTPTDSVPKSPSGSDSIQIVQTLISKSNSNSPSNNLVFVCEICDYVTNTKDALLSHKSTHVKSPKLQATTTTTSNDSKSDLYCKKCQKHFAFKGRYLKHRCPTNTDQYTVRFKNGKIQFRCRTCFHECNVKYNMEKHCRKHKQNNGLKEPERSETATYKCEICDFQTNLEDSLHNHQVVHININEVKVYKNKTYNIDMTKVDNSRADVKKEHSSNVPTN